MHLTDAGLVTWGEDGLQGARKRSQGWRTTITHDVALSPELVLISLSWVQTRRTVSNWHSYLTGTITLKSQIR